MKNKNIISALSFLTLGIVSLAGCQGNNNVTSLKFEKAEYSIYSGDSVTLKDAVLGVNYTIIDNRYPNKLSVDASSGKFTYSGIENNTQILYTAYKDNMKADPVVVTLLSDVTVPTLTFVDTTEYICNENYIYATSSTNSSIRYGLKEKVVGVHIEESSGLVTFTDAASEGTSFTVTISSNGAKEERTYKVAKEHLVTLENTKQATEINNKSAVCFYLNTESALEEVEVTKLITSHHVYDESYFEYDKPSKRLTIKKEALSTLLVGENIMTIVTSRNMINATIVMATKIITDVEGLLSIGESQEALRGYYILGNDIDLTSYLAIDGPGYNDGLGWNPIGIYHDVTDGTAFNDTFKGTFDGNGHVISGYKMNRRDEFGFNAGVFGYVYNLATIKNLGIVGNGDSTTASFAGALAGFNEGKIYNCWTNVNVSNNYGGNNYRIIGGFVGRNSGEIVNCYALGKVDGESQIGAFVGLNEGTIKNCYASKEGYQEFTTGMEPIDCTLFDTKYELRNPNPDIKLPASNWDLETTGYPTIKPELTFYYPYALKVENEDLDLVKGDVLTLDVHIYPQNVEQEYLDKVVITSTDPNVIINGFDIDTRNVTTNEFNVIVKIDEGGLLVEDVHTISLYDETTSITIDESLFTGGKVEPGEHYHLSAEVLPSSANQNVKWTLSPSIIKGVTLNGDELIIDETAERNPVSFSIVASSGHKEEILPLSIGVPNYLSSPMTVLYKDDEGDASFTFDNSVNLHEAKLYLREREISYTVSGSSIKIANEILKDNMESEVAFKFVLKNGEVYRLFATYINHNRYTLADIPSDAIALSSVSDFKKYFNISSASPTRFNEYYHRTFYLTNDIDFLGESIYGIGYTSESDSEYREFSGKIYGMGHKISNASISENEKYLTLTSQQKQDPYRASRYGVGFFGAFSGQCYDIIFENINVSGASWLGAFAGTMTASSIVENVSFVSSKVTNASGVDYSTEGLRTGRFTARNDGRMIGCAFNGSTLGLLG